jgi:hypothetical protein
MTVAGNGGTESRRVALFVLGEARSGTSAVARVLSLCGGDLEQRAAKVINEAILRRHGSSGLDPTLRLQEEGALDVAEKAVCIAEIQAFLTALRPAPFVVINDPRITLLSGLWFEAARLSGFDVVTVLSVRHPSEVLSTVAATGAMPEVASAWWLKVNLLAEADTRGVPRVFVEYANLVQDWRREVQRISVAVGIDLQTRDERAIEQFLKPNLHRLRHGGQMENLAGAEWISVVYEAMSAAARDQDLDSAELDRAFAAYRARERGFRPVFDGFARLDKMSKHFRPSVMNMIDKARATANKKRAN